MEKRSTKNLEVLTDEKLGLTPSSPWSPVQLYALGIITPALLPTSARISEDLIEGKTKAVLKTFSYMAGMGTTLGLTFGILDSPYKWYAAGAMAIGSVASGTYENWEGICERIRSIRHYV